MNFKLRYLLLIYKDEDATTTLHLFDASRNNLRLRFTGQSSLQPLPATAPQQLGGPISTAPSLAQPLFCSTEPF